MHLYTTGNLKEDSEFIQKAINVTTVGMAKGKTEITITTNCSMEGKEPELTKNSVTKTVVKDDTNTWNVLT